MDDAVMGSSIYPFLANLFMRYYETTNYCEITLYRWYVNDTTWFFNCESDSDKFFELLEKKHTNIKFMFQKEVYNWLIYYSSFKPFLCKVQLIRTLLHCAFISNSWFFFHEDVVKH